jgi:hypothetical protein
MLGPATITTADVDGADVDVSAAESVTFVYQLGTQAGTSTDLVIEEADDDGAGSPDTYSTVADADLIGGANEITVTTANDAAVITRGYKGTSAWVRITAVDNTTGNMPIAGCVIVGHQRHI